MAWIGLRDTEGTNRFELGGIGAQANAPKTHNATDLITRGTIVLEFTLDPDHVRQNLLRYAAAAPWHSSFRITIADDGTINLMMSQGHATVTYSLPTDLHTLKGCATIWYTWDSQRRTGVLCARSCSGAEYFADLLGPMPLSALDCDRLFTHPQFASLGPTTLFCAMADTIEPVGRPASLSGDAIVNTVRGPIPVRDVKTGMSLQTANGGRAQVLHVIEQTLPARGRFAPRIIRSPFYGATTDIAFGATHQIELAGSKIEYLFNQEHVLAEIGHLVDDNEIIVSTRVDLITYYHILLDHHDVITLSGVRATTLDPAPYQHNPSTLRYGILRNIPRELLPQSAGLDTPELQSYEATLIPLR